MATKQKSAEQTASVAELAVELDKSEKTLRAILRKHFTRSAELKNARWGDASNAHRLTAEQTEFLRSRFTKSEQTA